MHASGVLDISLSRTVYGLQQFSFADAVEIYVLEFEAKYLAWVLLFQFGSNNKVESGLVSFRTHPKGIHDSMNDKQKGNLEEHEPSVGNIFFF
jgi:hypothetical protein